MRKRDERFATQARHQQQPDPLHNKMPVKQTPAVFQPDDFAYDAEARTCVCPAGKSLYRTGKNLVTNGFVSEQFRGGKRDCGPCSLRAPCLRTPATTPVRNVAFFRGPSDPPAINQTARMYPWAPQVACSASPRAGTPRGGSARRRHERGARRWPAGHLQAKWADATAARDVGGPTGP